MANKDFDFKSGALLSYHSVFIWRIVQFTVWLAGVFILFCLVFYPSTGIMLFWNILIPIAPAILVLATGVWRNVCPLATTNLLPRHYHWSKRKRLTVSQLGKLNLMGVLVLYTIVPLRHAVFNVNGPATAALVMSMAFTGFGLGFIYEWKSVWCSGLCPVHPVEKLYGGNVLMPLPNAHCSECMNCVIPCPDSTPNMNPSISGKNIYQKWSAALIIGGLPGFIWGWFHVPDEGRITGLPDLATVYKLPVLGLVVSLLVYLGLSRIPRIKSGKKLIPSFAAAAVSCYYWFRIPSLFGFGRFAKDGLLVDISSTFPEWLVIVFTTLSAVFFFYWLVFRRANRNSWLIRPEFASAKRTKLKASQNQAGSAVSGKY
jgi:hypothetical protein